jgi:uncharacterized protein (DUF924 family)
MRLGLDRELTERERGFLYLPLMHSEELADQDLAVALFRHLDGGASLPWAERHREVIARFGRFPHRNAALGREDTAAERAFLADAERWGQ